MSRRATRLLDERLEPLSRKPKPERRFLATFVVFVSGKEAPETEEKVIEAPNHPAAVRIARTMCGNPMIFPVGRIARIPERNVTPLPEGENRYKYQAAFEIYRLGNRKSRPHISLMNIEAEGIREAEKIARRIARETPLEVKGVHASDTVVCPQGNVRRLK